MMASNPVGFQRGNQYSALSAKAKRITATLERACLADDGERLRAGVEKLLDEFAAGEQWAMQMVWDRLEGKVQPAIGDDGEGGIPFSAIKLIVVEHVQANHGQTIEQAPEALPIKEADAPE